MKNCIRILTVLMVSCSPGVFSQNVKPEQSPGGADPAVAKGETTRAAITKKPDPGIPDECPDGEARVRVRMLLQATGKVTEVEVTEKSICEAVDKSAVKAARKIKFTPAREGGVAVSKYVTIDYSYRKSKSFR